MTRILQIRRGTSAQNDNFTGLSGEITMDTTNKTIRIHDGETLGGIALARDNTVVHQGEIVPFDINTVSADFWQNLFATYQSAPFKTQAGNLMNVVNNAAFFDDSFSELTDLPLFVRASLVCQDDNAGYATGDETYAFGIGDYVAPLVYSYIDNGIVHARLFSGAQTFWVPHKTTGIRTNLTASKWKLKMTVYY